MPGSERENIAPLIQLDHIRKFYGKGEAEVRALDDVSLTIEQGEFVAVMGASGSGKSTCMNMIGCLDVPTGGEFFFKGVAVGSLNPDQRAILRRNHIGFVFQSHNLLARTSALENVELPLVYRGSNAQVRKEKATAALARVGLAERLVHTPAELSGGQQQRVAIARALVSDPSLILADEPTGNLDSQRSLEIMALLCELNDQGITIVMVTHENDMAAFATRVIVFKDGKVLSDNPNPQRVWHKAETARPLKMKELQ